MPDVAESCKRSFEISIPVAEVEAETSRVLADVKKKAKMPGFRPGKVPESLIKKHFESDIRQRVLESLIPKHLQSKFEEENLQVVGTPDISDVHLHEGEPLQFKADFEVVPEIDLGEYNGLEVVYDDPQVTDEDVDKRIEELRNSHGEVRLKTGDSRDPDALTCCFQGNRAARRARMVRVTLKG